MGIKFTVAFMSAMLRRERLRLLTVCFGSKEEFFFINKSKFVSKLLLAPVLLEKINRFFINLLSEIFLNK
jgi:hypothetical protein